MTLIIKSLLIKHSRLLRSLWFAAFTRECFFWPLRYRIRDKMHPQVFLLMEINLNLKESPLTRKSGIATRTAITTTILFSTLLATITLSMMTPIKRRKKSSGGSSLKNAPGKMKKGTFNIILPTIAHRQLLLIRPTPLATWSRSKTSLFQLCLSTMTFNKQIRWTQIMFL